MLILVNVTTAATLVHPVKGVTFMGVHYTISPQKDTIGFTMPFTRAGNLILLQATADSVKGSFILDTGNPGLVLNLTYFRQYTRVVETEEDTRGINGSIGQAEKIVIQDFSFGKIKNIQQKADLVSLGAIENAKNIKIIGLIGMRFLKNCEMIIDYESNTIAFTIIPSKMNKTYKNPLLKDTSAVKILPFEIIENRILVNAQIATKKLKFVIDCAAESNILDSRLPNYIFETLNVIGKVVLTGVGNKKIEALQGEITGVKIGSKTINQLPFIVTNLEKTCFSDIGCVDGVLGFDFLSLQKIGFNFVTNQIYLWQ